ncbi:hypothetical protein [Fonticella tunisiensis]|uniref:Uncharacterized protein n=1 Tax=Fonticella tunisiensis TaxID=1096341 RepID=A0A4R7KBW1_9CLOT|nr:hypothetical protein [Fonticella tunisiensis]TDT51281.1 hypothetical protein EDD71_11911 [Fonticella tunisiensis]
MKSWVKYFINILLILIIMFFGEHVFEGITKNIQTTFKMNPFLINMVMIIFYGCIGLLLGLEHLINEINKEGTWIINSPKIVFMVLPSLYFSFAMFLYYSSIQFVRNILAYPVGILLESGTNFMHVFQLIFGYSIITSFYKRSEKM